MNASYPSRAIIDLDAYRFNLQRVQGLSGGAKLIPVLKANAYGHGLIPLAHAALQLDVNMLAVATVQEGIDLRENGIKTPILVMVSPNKKELPLFLEYQLILTVVNKEIAQEISALAHGANRVAPIHCKIDTGMGRQGVALEEAMEMIQFVSRLTPLDIQGIFTHFPSADEADPKFTQNQIKAFRKLIKQVDKVGFPYEIAHAANSAAIVNYPKSCFDAVRPGLISYGVWPTPENNGGIIIKPVLRWETTVVQVRTLDANTTVGYGRTYTAELPTKTAVLPVGYADGYKYQLSNKAFVLIGGNRCRVLGTVCMDQIVVDVSALPTVASGDTAVLLGTDGNEHITAEELAQLAGTIPYDILTGIGTRVRREYIGGSVKSE